MTPDVPQPVMRIAVHDVDDLWGEVFIRKGDVFIDTGLLDHPFSGFRRIVHRGAVKSLSVPALEKFSRPV